MYNCLKNTFYLFDLKKSLRLDPCLRKLLSGNQRSRVNAEGIEKHTTIGLLLE